MVVVLVQGVQGVQVVLVFHRNPARLLDFGNASVVEAG